MTHPTLVVVPKPIESVPRSVPSTAEGTAPDPDWAPIGKRLAAARAEHLATLADVRRVFDAAAAAGRCEVRWWTSELTRSVFESADAVVTVGGDGTFLTAARFATKTPIVGVNSSPSTSIGHYCAATGVTFGEVLERILAHLGRSATSEAPRALTRIRAEVMGVVLPFDALNDVLFAHRSPVASTRYALHVNDESALQLSSGIWVATASGSTAAIRSAGGRIMELDDPRLQWKVREPFLREGVVSALDAGFTQSAIEILSRSDKNALFLDGQPEAHTVAFGARARLYRSPDPLLAYLP